MTKNNNVRAANKSGPYRVMLVDDSSVIRGVLARWLSADPAIEIVASVSNGEIAIKSIEKFDPEIVVLDIEMPVMDGLTALPKILEVNPNIQVLMSSTLTSKNAAISLKAMSLGAADYVPKPTTNREVMSSQSFQSEITEKIKSLALTKRRLLGYAPFRASIEEIKTDFVKLNNKETVKDIQTRNLSNCAPKIIGIGSSTGGPQALLKFLDGIKEELSLPVVITQHMPAAFTKILANHLEKSTGLPCTEAEDGMLLEAGHVYVAPGDYHMVVKKESGKTYLRLNQDPPENFCRPSVDPMFRSLAEEFGPSVLGVILTGMGHDGLEGSKLVVNGGGTVVAQNEATSVVWGMPRAVSEAGLCSAVLPLDDLADKVKRVAKGSRL